MKFGSLFSGAGGFDMGFHQAGFDCLWTAEINRDASDVLAKLSSTNLGDVTKINGETLAVPDVVIWGSPCQNLSVANSNREGLAGESSQLFWEGIRILKPLRDRGLRFSIWENVAGALDSNEGRDFHQIVSAFWQLGAHSLAWRVLDGRYFGVAQTRRRVFVVADFGGNSAGEILCDATASRLRFAEGEDDGLDILTGSRAGTLSARNPARSARPDNLHWTIRTQRPANEMIPGYMIVHPSMMCRQPQRGGRRPGEFIQHPSIATNPTRSQSPGSYLHQSLLTHPDKNLRDCRFLATEEFRLRWRTPLESERLMGWPDNWTQIGKSGKEMSDSARYQMTGNGVIATVAEWLAIGVREAVS